MLSRVGFAGETLPNKFSGLGKKTGRMATASTGATVELFCGWFCPFKGAKRKALYVKARSARDLLLTYLGSMTVLARKT